MREEGVGETSGSSAALRVLVRQQGCQRTSCPLEKSCIRQADPALYPAVLSCCLRASQEQCDLGKNAA